MSKYIRLFFVVAALMLAVPTLSHAQDAAPAAEPASVKVDEDSLKKLITTLESESARQDLLTNLKTLLEQQQGAGEEKVEEAIAPLTKTLGVETFTSRLIDRYQAFLERNDLSGTTVGKSILTLIVTIAGAVLIYVLRRGVTKLMYWFDRAVEWIDLPAKRLRLYTRILRHVVTIGLAGLVLYTFSTIWDLGGENNPFQSDWFKTAVKTALNITFVVVLATMAWETLSALLQLTFKKLDGASSSRAQTIMPIVRNILFIVFAILFVLMLLSEIGIDIVPLLAGAGIVGVAIGFGAQTMVKDFLTGFTIILEDVVRVGDVAGLGGHTGVIEKITLRKIQLRDYSGIVYTIPFSEITTISNLTKDFSFYEINMGVAYKEDTDEVVEIMRDVCEEMRNDSEFGADILEPIEIAGVDKFADSAVIIKARIKTAPIKQWNTGREFNRRLKKAFDAKGIEIPFPQQATWHMNPVVNVVEEKDAEKKVIEAKKGNKA